MNKTFVLLYVVGAVIALGYLTKKHDAQKIPVTLLNIVTMFIDAAMWPYTIGAEWYELSHNKESK